MVCTATIWNPKFLTGQRTWVHQIPSNVHCAFLRIFLFLVNYVYGALMRIFQSSVTRHVSVFVVIWIRKKYHIDIFAKCHGWIRLNSAEFVNYLWRFYSVVVRDFMEIHSTLCEHCVLCRLWYGYMLWLKYLMTG